MIEIRRAATFVVVAVLLLPTAHDVAWAAPTRSTSVPVMIVLDASGSMNAKDAPGRRIDAAKRAVDDLVDSLSPDAKVGLLVYGTGTSSADSAKTAGCRDIKSVVPFGPVDKPAFKAAVARVKARGYTPIGEALKTAARQLPRTGPRSIVLVSDGEDTCAPPSPCTTARHLKAAGTDLTVHSVGFKVGATARSQLTCIAAATGGSYRETDQGSELADVLVNRVGEALRAYTAVGKPVNGSQSPIGAPSLTAGQYRDSFARPAASSSSDDGAAKYYAVQLGAGETLHATATLVTPPLAVTSGQNLTVNIKLLTPDGASCAEAYESGSETHGKIPALTEALSARQGDARLDYGCKEHAGQFVLRIVRSGTAFVGTTLAAEISIRIEAPGDATGLPGAPAKRSDDVSPAADRTPVELDGGSSFDNAPLLKPGTYRDTVVSGEARYYRVHVDYGQRLTYRIGVPGVQADSADEAMYLAAHIASPLRPTVEQANFSASATYYGNRAVTVHGAAAFPARWTNRFALDSSIRGYQLDGDYYLWFDTTFVAGSQYQLPLTLTVDVVGSREAGPAYGRLGPSVPPQTTRATTTPPVTTTTPTAARSSAAAAGDGKGSVVLPLLGIAGLLVIAAAVGGVLLHRRRAPAHAGGATPHAPTQPYGPRDR